MQQRYDLVKTYDTWGCNWGH